VLESVEGRGVCRGVFTTSSLARFPLIAGGAIIMVSNLFGSAATMYSSTAVVVGICSTCPSAGSFSPPSVEATSKLLLGLSLIATGLPVREGTPEDRARESAFSAFCAMFFAAIALAKRSCNRSFVLFIEDVLEEPVIPIRQSLYTIQ
jgi:hypothetical protein